VRRLIGTSTKMNLTSSEAERYFETLRPLVDGVAACELFVLPPFTAIWVARRCLAGSKVAWGAQDVHPDEAGAHTGDVSAAMLADLGCTYVEVGHSERRRDYAETDARIAAKVGRILRHGMTPILCVGEPTQRPTDQALEFVLGQLRADLAEVPGGTSGSTGGDGSGGARLIVAYEPVWAIGVGAKSASPAHVTAVHRGIRAWLGSPEAHGVEARVIYGGSVDVERAGPLLEDESVDGLFVGRAALDPAVFAAIALTAERLTSETPAG
jgi:triosephosphate isomerase (TIM)